MIHACAVLKEETMLLKTVIMSRMHNGPIYFNSLWVIIIESDNILGVVTVEDFEQCAMEI